MKFTTRPTTAASKTTYISHPQLIWREHINFVGDGRNKFWFKLIIRAQTIVSQ